MAQASDNWREKGSASPWRTLPVEGKKIQIEAAIADVLKIIQHEEREPTLWEAFCLVGALHRTFDGLFEIAATYIDDLAEKPVHDLGRSQATVAELREWSLERMGKTFQQLSRLPAQYPPIFWRQRTE